MMTATQLSKDRFTGGISGFAHKVFFEFVEGQFCFFLHERMLRKLLANVQQKNMKMLLLSLKCIRKRLFIQPVCFAQQAFDAVTIHCFFEMFGTNTHTRLYGHGACCNRHIKYFHRKAQEGTALRKKLVQRFAAFQFFLF